MNSRERLLSVVAGKIPDCVPVAPDFSNMIPARLTGKPFWDLYLYNDPPIWEAYIDCAKHFDIDALMDGYFPLTFPDEINREAENRKEVFVIERSEERIIVRTRWDKKVWDPTVDVYPVKDPPTRRIPVEKLGLPLVPDRYELLEGVKAVDTSPAGFYRLLERMGSQGLAGVKLATSAAIKNEEQILWYYNNPDKHEEFSQKRIEAVEKRFERIMSMETRPDFLCVGGSGTLVFQTEEMFRTVAFPAVKRAIELATRAGIPTHMHSCGPERELVRIMAEESTLSIIDPLEKPPMGDCELSELKKNWGDRITLKGNLHTTSVMLEGSTDDVAAASRKAIDDAAEGGRFILSTGDQCGRDTPDDNIRVMVETARSYGKY